jgi:hypothetical protein
MDAAAEEARATGTDSRICEGRAVEQELVIRPDGRLEIPWVTPEATRLVVEVYTAVSDEPFPVGIVSGNLYCG